MFPWSDAPTTDPHHVAAYAVGDTIFSGTCRGRAASVSTVVSRLVSVVWDDSKDGGEIVYPMDAPYLRKGLPWE